MQVYTRLQERLGLKDHAMILNVMLSKIAINLKVYGSCDDIITQTLNLFQVRPCTLLRTQLPIMRRVSGKQNPLTLVTFDGLPWVFLLECTHLTESHISDVRSPPSLLSLQKIHLQSNGARSLSLSTVAVQDLAAGYTSGKLLLKLDFTSYILQHHTAEHFAFLDDPANSRSRTTFYFTLARLLFVEDTAAKFKAFVAPLQQARPTAPETLPVITHVL